MLKLGYADEYGRTVYRCPEQDCYYARQVPRADLPPEHKCPEMNGTTKVGWTVYGPSLLEKCWAELDSVIDEIMAADHTEPSVQVTKGYARGLAYTLSLFMAPHLTTPADVSKEAKKRWNARQVGDTEYCTPGLAARKYEPPPGDHKLSRQTEQRAKMSNPKPPSHNLTDEQINMIKAAAGMFSPEDLAGMYDTTVAVIKSVL